MENYYYGYTCGPGGGEPKGRKAFEKIVEAKRFDLLRNIIRGYNPEGRAYALEAFLAVYSEAEPFLTKEDKSCIKKLLLSDIQINACGGCDAFPESYNEIFGYSNE